MMTVRFDTYYRHEELTAILRDYAAAYPDLCQVYSLGLTPEGREMWLMEITGPPGGAPGAKPGFYIDGNTHAGEVTGSAACLYTIHHLLTGYATSPKVRRLVDTTTFYIRPRVSPDGAELYLTTPHNLRSVPRPYPHPDRQPGLHPADVNGDGWITLMRIADPDGDWQVSPEDPRLMVRRRDDVDAAETCYRLFPEGLVHGPLAGPLAVAKPYWGLDLNRNFPANWQPEHVQQGSGPYPLSEPETRVSADFILAHPDIAMIICYHTHGGFAFRPPSSRPARDFSRLDIDVIYRVLGDKFTECTGGPVRQSYDEATGTARSGSLMDWGYQHLGIIGWVPELWSWGRDYNGAGKRSELDYLRWNDEELGGEGFLAWQPFEHPQLGPVEIGGWKTKFTSQNPPGHLLEPELRRHHEWTLYLAEALPRLQVTAVDVETLAPGLHRVTAAVRNSGLLPTNLTDQAVKTGKAGRLTVRLAVPPGMEIVDGPATQELEHLAGRISAPGRAEALYHYLYFSSGPLDRPVVTASWVVRDCGCPGPVTVEAAAPKAGRGAAEAGIPS